MAKNQILLALLDPKIWNKCEQANSSNLSGTSKLTFQCILQSATNLKAV